MTDLSKLRLLMKLAFLMAFTMAIAPIITELPIPRLLQVFIGLGIPLTIGVLITLWHFGDKSDKKRKPRRSLASGDGAEACDYCGRPSSD